MELKHLNKYPLDGSLTELEKKFYGVIFDIDNGVHHELDEARFLAAKKCAAIAVEYMCENLVKELKQ